MSPNLQLATREMLGLLRSRLSPSPPKLPEPRVSIQNLVERPVGIGNHRGNEIRGPLRFISLGGLRLAGRVRFELWAKTVQEIDDAVLKLQETLARDRDGLRKKGFLRLAPAETAVAEHQPKVKGWRKSTSYDILYEYHYLLDDEAQSLIVKIPIFPGLERRGSPEGEHFLVRGELARWDNEEAPVLEVRGPFRVSALSALTYVPGAMPQGGVTLLRTHDAAAGSPAIFPTLDNFLQATTGDRGVHHAVVRFSSLDRFLTALDLTADPVILGDWNEDGHADSYDIRSKSFPFTMALPASSDRFEIAYQGTALDRVAVLYLSVERR